MIVKLKEATPLVKEAAPSWPVGVLFVNEVSLSLQRPRVVTIIKEQI